MQRTRFPRPLKFESLESRELLSTLTTETEPNDRKAAADIVVFDPVDSSADIAGNLSQRRDRDYFRFTAEANGQLHVSITTSDGLIAKLQIATAAGVELFETEPNAGIHSGSFAVEAGQTIFLRVRGQGKSLGDYLVHLTPDAGTGGSEPGNTLIESEPNDAKGTADRFALGSDGQIQLQGNSSSHRDKDYFVFMPAVSGNLQVTVQSPNGQFAKLQLASNDEVTVFETEPNDGINSGSVAVTAGTTYFIRLRSQAKVPAQYLVDLALI